MLPVIVEENCDYCITWFGWHLFIYKRGYIEDFGLPRWSLDADNLFAICTPLFMLYFPQWFYNWLYRNEVKDA